MDSAILLAHSIRYRGSYHIEHRYTNGVVIGATAELNFIAITVDILAVSTSLHPVVGGYTPDPEIAIGTAWIYPAKASQAVSYFVKDWLRELRITSRLAWLKRLGQRIQQPAVVKVAVENYSLADVTTLGRRGWLVGRSAHAPLCRLYARIPAEVYEYGELPALDGMLRSLSRYGALFDPSRHKIAVKI